MHIFKDTHFDFLRWRWHAIAFSLILIVAGIATIVTKGIPKGVEFAGGTVVIEQFEQPVTDQQVRAALEQTFGQNIIINATGDPSQRLIMIRVPQVGAESGASLSQTAEQVEAALRKENLGNFKREGAEIVSATVGRELTNKGIWATALSLVGILAYISFRFQLSFAVGAVVATVHDLLVTFAFLAFFGYDLTLNVIAALLTITGFSTNDTIVIFDRVRENLRGDAARQPRPHHQRRDQSDPRPDHHHVGHGAAVVARAVVLRRRCAPRLRVHDGGRHHHRHVFDGVHRRGDRQLLAGRRADAGGGARHGARRPRRNSPLAGRSLRGRLARRRLSAGRFQPRPGAGRSPRKEER